MAISTSIMTGGSNNHVTTSEEANGIATDFVSEGVIGSITNTSTVAPMTGAYSVNAQGTPDMTVAVGSGVAYVTGTPSSQNSQTFRVYNSASSNVTISANSSGSTKYDWIYIQLDATLLADPTLAGTTTATLVTSRSSSSTTDNGTPPTYGYPLAVVTVINGATSISNSSIRDLRSGASISNASDDTTWSGYVSNAMPVVSSVTNNGNGSHTVVYASSVASLVSPGQKHRFTRTVTAPTQCTSLNGTTQYWTKASPSGTLIGTTAFSVSVKCKPSAYQNGVLWNVGNSTSNGAYMYMNPSGQVIVIAFQDGANYRTVTTYQSLVLNRWQTVTALFSQTGTCYILFNGVVVPSITANAGAPTTITAPTTNLRFGANSGGTFFAGKISCGHLFSVQLTESTARSYLSQAPSGSETSCTGAWTFNGNANDSNANANNLSAGGSATATNADAPFAQDSNAVAGGTYDFALVQSVSTTTVVYQSPEGCAIPTSGGVTTVDIAPSGTPLGFPMDRARWELTILLLTDTNHSSVAAAGYFSTGALNLPIGNYDVDGYGSMYYDDNAASTGVVTAGIGTTTSSFTSGLISRMFLSNTGSTQIAAITRFYFAQRLQSTSMTPYYLNAQTQSGNMTNFQFYCSTSDPTVVRAVPSGI